MSSKDVAGIVNTITSTGLKSVNKLPATVPNCGSHIDTSQQNAHSDVAGVVGMIFELQVDVKQIPFKVAKTTKPKYKPQLNTDFDIPIGHYVIREDTGL